jgi:hypothetical protein
MSANWVKVKLDRGRVKEVTDTRMDIREVLAVLYSQAVVEGMVHRDSLADALVQLYKDNS